MTLPPQLPENENFQNHKAFTLIEVSVVMIIIGLLVIGIIGGRKLVDTAALNKARALTNSSPVNGVENLVLWLESTSKDSFSVPTPPDSTKLTLWNDINPQGLIKNDATQSGATGIRPTYMNKGIHNIPAVDFDGTADYMNLPADTVPSANSNYTVFIVSKADSNGNFALLGSGTYGTAGAANAFVYDTSNKIANYWGDSDGASADDAINATEPNIFSFYYNSTETPSRKVYVNGVSVETDNDNTRDSATTNNLVGRALPGDIYMDGMIGEIIVFKRAINPQEMREILSYLGSKWHISVAN